MSDTLELNLTPRSVVSRMLNIDQAIKQKIYRYTLLSTLVIRICLPHPRHHQPPAPYFPLPKLPHKPLPRPHCRNPQIHCRKNGSTHQCPIHPPSLRRRQHRQQRINGHIAGIMRTNNVGEQRVVGELIVRVLGAEAVEVGVVGVLQVEGCEDSWDD
jgi:hypothetical protein